MAKRIWKVYIPSSLYKEPKTTLLIGWIDKINDNIIVVSYVKNPIGITNDDKKRNSLLQKIESINTIYLQSIQSKMQCMIIGSTNITKYDCSDLMRIYNNNAWIQCDKYLNLKQVLSINKNDLNNYYQILYESYPFDNFSPYYTNYINHEILNESNYIHSYFHKSDKNQISINWISNIFCFLLLKYFQIINVFYGIFYQIIVFIPPLFILSQCRMTQELRLNNEKFGKLIKYLQTKSSPKQSKKETYSKQDFNDIDVQRENILNICSDIFQHFFNLFLGFLFGYFVYFYMDQYCLDIISNWLSFFDYNSKKCYIAWLMGNEPIGLKLNTSLNYVFGKLSLLCLEILHIQIPNVLYNKTDELIFLTIWDVFDESKEIKCIEKHNDKSLLSLSDLIIIYLPMIKIYLFILSSCFGITFILSLISDVISLLSLPFDIVYRFFLYGYKLEAKLLSIFGKLFRGLKYNQLKKRVDKCSFDTDQLFIGIILFSTSIFILPTLVVYFIYFSFTMIYIWIFQLILNIIQMIIHYLPIGSFIFLLFKPKFICNGYEIEINNDNDNDNENLIKLKTKSSKLKYLKQYVKNNFFYRISCFSIKGIFVIDMY